MEELSEGGIQSTPRVQLLHSCSRIYESLPPLGMRGYIPLWLNQLVQEEGPPDTATQWYPQQISPDKLPLTYLWSKSSPRHIVSKQIFSTPLLNMSRQPRIANIWWRMLTMIRVKWDWVITNVNYNVFMSEYGEVFQFCWWVKGLTWVTGMETKRPNYKPQGKTNTCTKKCDHDILPRAAMKNGLYGHNVKTQH